MHFRPPYRPAGDRVYHAIKARLIAYDFPQGRRIYLEPIAESLGVSTTPVREAMNRLAERDLVIKAENKGFYAMTLSAERLRGNYELTRLLLTLTLETLTADAVGRLLNHTPVVEMIDKLHRRLITDAGVLASYTGQIFGAFAILMDNSAVALAIERANDHLHFVRTLECKYFEDVQQEMQRLCELTLSGKRNDLVAALNTYHDRRLVLLPALLHDAGF